MIPRKKPGKPSIRIHSVPSGNRVHVIYGATERKGLDDFFKKFLKPKGFEKQYIEGNALLVSKDGQSYEFRAYKEAS
jgi:hypothetical protein